MDYEFEAFKKGFNEAMMTMWAVFDIKTEDIQEKMSFGILNNKIYELYQIWQNTIKDDKIERENNILLKKITEKTDKIKKLIIQYIEKKMVI